ncbi:n-acetylglutamate synthase [Bacillus atrophaeus]|uniref:n-acetylglutamate synthase n=1 Tax=Bacillus atrophaeus TaxID=1452 RepID=UPI003CCFA488
MELINYDGRIFIGVHVSEDGEVSGETVFHYKQDGIILSGTYAGGGIISGVLVGTVKKDDTLYFRYHHVNAGGKLESGECVSSPQVGEDGRVRLHEEWQMMDGQKSKGSSVVEEIES